MNDAAVKGVGSCSSAEGSVKLWSSSEDSPVRFGLICQFAVILLPSALLCHRVRRLQMAPGSRPTGGSVHCVPDPVADLHQVSPR